MAKMIDKLPEYEGEKEGLGILIEESSTTIYSV